MLIQYIGHATIREWPPYRFTPSNGKCQSVDDVATLQEMLTQPGDDFKVHALDPLAQAVGVDRAAELVLKGITTVDAWRATQKSFVEEVGRPSEPLL